MTELPEGKMTGTPGLDHISTKRRQIAMLAREAPELAFTTLSHHLDMDWMKEAFRRTRKDGATGIDGQTAEEYAAQLEENLGSLLERVKSGQYRAPPVRRVHIPKSDGTTRPLGIPTFEDKVLQQAVKMVLEPIYEQDFHAFSHGFRPRKSAHEALASFWKQSMDMGGGWVLEVDISKFFDTLNHGQLQELMRKRVRDGVLLKLIGKWLKAGVMEDGCVTHSDAGTPQGGVISPLLANVYLHEALDEWFLQEVLPRLKGRAFLVRYADDFVIGFTREQDARRVMEVLPKRFGKYGLTIHPEKTRLVRFRPQKKHTDDESPGSFDLLGFTHFWGRSRKGLWVIKRKTAKGRFKRGLKAIATWCHEAKHRPVKEQHRILWQKLKGHFAYYGITGNALWLDRFRNQVRRTWRKALARRSQTGMPWERFAKLEIRFPLPPAIAVHSVLRRVAKP